MENLGGNERIPVVGGNWGMNPNNLIDAGQLAKGIDRNIVKAPDQQVIIYPPSIYLHEVREILDGRNIREMAGFVHASFITEKLEELMPNVSLGAQNFDLITPKLGTRTGEISARMLADIGCTHALIGHSDRRRAGETDQDVVRKIDTAFATSCLTPTVCVGENLGDRLEIQIQHFTRRR